MTNIEDWNKSRRQFIKGLVAAGIMTQIGFLESCNHSDDLIKESFFSENELKNITEIINVLFPDNGNGPSAGQINVIPHIIWTIQDKTFGYDAYDMFLISLEKLSEHCNDMYKKDFKELDTVNKNRVIESISVLKWGERLLSNTTNYIFEALVLDPSYNVNRNEVGWDWLGHIPGYPRPLQKDLYPKFIERL
ncbi:MAG: gluconate 2-dehydrogenase subunit 3 family protein [Crocinitomicaceae bacterium]